MNVRFSDSSLRGSMIDAVIDFMVEENVVGYVPRQARRRFENNIVPRLLATTFRTSLTKLAMRKPSNTCKRHTLLEELRNNVEVVSIIQIP